MYGERLCYDVVKSYCLNEQLYCCVWSCLDVVHFIVKKQLCCFSGWVVFEK